jgi:hypothetical protein
MVTIVADAPGRLTHIFLIIVVMLGRVVGNIVEPIAMVGLGVLCPLESWPSIGV